MIRLFLLLILVFQCAQSSAQSCNPDSLINRSYRAFITDSNIEIEIKKHQIYLNPSCIQNDKLLLHLVGSIDNPESTTYFPIIAANNGYKAISLKYPNKTAAVLACGNSNDIDCYSNFREEIIFGNDSSPNVSVDSNNCIINRTEKLLSYLHELFPSENWDAFLNSNGSINWSKIVLSGHSQGGGHAGFIAKLYEVNRVLMFAAPNDYSNFFSSTANWVTTPSITPDTNYYAFGNLFDDVVDFEKQFEIWEDMKLFDFADSTNVDKSVCNYNNSKILYTKDESSTGFSGNHNSVIIDNYTPITNNIPDFTPVWEYMLGICDVVSSVSKIEDKTNQIRVFPNPSKSLVYVENNETISKLEIYNSSGSLLELFHPHQTEFSIDLGKFEGLLILKFSFSSGNINKYKSVIIQ